MLRPAATLLRSSGLARGRAPFNSDDCEALQHVAVALHSVLSAAVRRAAVGPDKSFFVVAGHFANALEMMVAFVWKVCPIVVPEVQPR